MVRIMPQNVWGDVVAESSVLLSCGPQQVARSLIAGGLSTLISAGVMVFFAVAHFDSLDGAA
jgi:hypothetical protein